MSRGVHALRANLRLWLPFAAAAACLALTFVCGPVLTVGTATLAAFIGGGGYGTLIVTGLALNDVSTILAGAIPAALMALGLHGVFEAVDRVVVTPT